jgi:hypothetical protein
LLIAAPHMLFQKMSAGRFVLRKVAPGTVRHPGTRNRARRPGAILSRRLTSREEQKEDTKPTASRR